MAQLKTVPMYRNKFIPFAVVRVRNSEPSPE